MWIERVTPNQRNTARASYADDRDARVNIQGAPPRGPLYDELEDYIATYKARERPDVVYLNVVDDGVASLPSI